MELDMAIKITMTDNIILGGGSIVSSPSDADYVFEGSGNKIRGMGDMFLIRGTSEQEYLERLGLKEGVDLELINRVLSQLHAIPQATEAEKVKVVEESGLAGWLNIGSSVASLTESLVGVVAQILQQG
jgi:hypothetical protein